MSPDTHARQGSAESRLRRLTGDGAAVPVSLFMAYANAEYYATRDPLGVAGDFITAPEISQMFGELIGLWCADLWTRAGSPDIAWVELGPGRGTLALDARRAMARFGLDPEVHLVETSPVLRDIQAARLGPIHFHADVSTLPRDRPLIIIANEFFDALPIRQLVLTDDGWRERLVAREGDRFMAVAGRVPMNAAVPPTLRYVGTGAIVESSPASVSAARDLGATLAAAGGAMLVIDYGYAAPAPGDTLQAVERHRFADPFEAPGTRDLTAHVDFAALAEVGQSAGMRVEGPVGQGAFLRALGIEARAHALAGRHPEQAPALTAALDRLTGEEAMGTLFKAMAWTAPTWPAAEGFDA